jgi:hypothetical protein
MMNGRSSAQKIPFSIGQIRRRFLVVPVTVIFAIWALLYLPHLRDSPRWYGDETLTLMIGRALFAGHPADRALKITFWHPSYSYQPGYAWIVGGAAWLLRGDILGARILNVLIALAIGMTIYLGGRSVLGHLPAWFGALMFLGYQQSVIHFRWIYPHNAVAFGLLISVLAILRSSRPKVDWIAGAGLGLAAMSHPVFTHGAIAAVLCRIKEPRSWLRLATLPTIIVFLSLCSAAVRYWPENWLPQDLSELFDFYRHSSAESGSGVKTIQNIANFYGQDFFHIGAWIGCVLCIRRKLYPITVFAFVISGLLLQNRQNIPIFYYQAVTFLPVLALAWAGGLRVVIGELRKLVRGSPLLPRSVAIGAFLLVMILTTRTIPASFSGRLVSRNDFWVTQIPSEVEQAAGWLNERLSGNELVICGPNIAWLLHCRVADFIQATAWQGKRTFTFERPVRRERFLYPADVNQARYVVIGDIEQRWTFAQPGVSDILDQLATDKWTIAWRGRFYLVLENPKLKRR